MRIRATPIKSSPVHVPSHTIITIVVHTTRVSIWGITHHLRLHLDGSQPLTLRTKEKRFYGSREASSFPVTSWKPTVSKRHHPIRIKWHWHRRSWGRVIEVRICADVCGGDDEPGRRLDKSSGNRLSDNGHRLLVLLSIRNDRLSVHFG